MDPNIGAAGCVVLGFLLLFVEMFLIPGIGFTGLFGTAFICFGGGLVWIEHGMAAGLTTLIGSGIAAIVLAWSFWKSGAAKRFVLDKKLDDKREDEAERASLQGRTGVAITSLRPAGQAEIDGKRYDVLTDGVFVDAGAAVTVIEVEGFRVVVEDAGAPENGTENDQREENEENTG